MAFTSDFINSERALRGGFVNAVYPNQDELLKAAREMASKIASMHSSYPSANGRC